MPVKKREHKEGNVEKAKVYTLMQNGTHKLNEFCEKWKDAN